MTHPPSLVPICSKWLLYNCWTMGVSVEEKTSFFGQKSNILIILDLAMTFLAIFGYFWSFKANYWVSEGQNQVSVKSKNVEKFRFGSLSGHFNFKNGKNVPATLIFTDRVKGIMSKLIRRPKKVKTGPKMIIFRCGQQFG